MLLEHSRRFWIFISRFLFNSLSGIVSFVSVRLSCLLGKIPLQLIDYWLVATSHTGLKRWRAFCCYGCNGMGMHMARLDFSVFLLLLRPSSYDDISWMDFYGYGRTGWMDGMDGIDGCTDGNDRPAFKPFTYTRICISVFSCYLSCLPGNTYSSGPIPWIWCLVAGRGN